MRRAAMVGLLLVACGSAVRSVPLGPIPLGAATTNPEFPPPPANVERIPADPGAQCVWEDGYWYWASRRWEWEAGRWVLPPNGCHFTEPGLRWLPAGDHGTLSYVAPAWYPNEAAKGRQAVPCARATDCRPTRR